MTHVIRFFLCAIIVIASFVTVPTSIQNAQKTSPSVPDRYQMPVAQTESLPKYVTKRGESSTKIGRKFNVDKKEVRRLNKLSPVKGKHGRNFYFFAPKTTIFLPALQLDGSPVKVNPAGFAIVTKKATKANSAIASARTQKERVDAKSKPVPVKPTISSGVKKPKKQTAEALAVADRLRRYHEQQRRDAQQAKRDATVAKNVPPVETVAKSDFDALEKRKKELLAEFDKYQASTSKERERLKQEKATLEIEVGVMKAFAIPVFMLGFAFGSLAMALYFFYLTRSEDKKSTEKKDEEDNSFEESKAELDAAPQVVPTSHWISKAKNVALWKFFEENGHDAEVLDQEDVYDVLVTGRVRVGKSAQSIVREAAQKLIFQAYSGAEPIGNQDTRDGEPIFIYCWPNGTVMDVIGEPDEVLRLSAPPNSKKEEAPVDTTTAKTKVFEEPKGLGKSGNMAREMYIPPAPDTVVNTSVPTIIDPSAQGVPTVPMMPPPTPPRPMTIDRSKEGAPTVPILSAPTSPNGAGKVVDTQVHVHPDVR